MNKIIRFIKWFFDANWINDSNIFDSSEKEKMMKTMKDINKMSVINFILLIITITIIVIFKFK